MKSIVAWAELGDAELLTNSGWLDTLRSAEIIVSVFIIEFEITKILRYLNKKQKNSVADMFAYQSPRRVLLDKKTGAWEDCFCVRLRCERSYKIS